MEDAGLTKKDFDGQGLAAIYTTNHSQPFWPEEVAAILGITPGVSLAGGNGGASSVSLLGHAAATITAGLCDLVLIALKATNNDVLPELIPPLLHETTALLPLQNGLGNEEFLARHFGAERVMGGLCFICLNRVSPGVDRAFRLRTSHHR